jgi:hypothetical protein
VATRRRLLLALLVGGLVACSSSSGDDARPAPATLDDGTVLVGYLAPWVEQFDSGVANDCRLVLESNPPVCGGPVPIEGLDLRKVPEAEQDPFRDAVSEPDRWALYDTYLRLAFEPDGTVTFVDLEPGGEADPPPTLVCPELDVEPLPRADLRELRGDPNFLGGQGRDDLALDVVYLNDDVVDEVCEATGVPTTITARGEVLED